jgi:hypothetical protein
MEYKTDCRKCKNNIKAGFFNRPHCIVTGTAEELTQWLYPFVNYIGCMSFEEKREDER